MTTLEEVFLRLGEKEEFYSNSGLERTESDNNSDSILLKSASTGQLNDSVEAGLDPSGFHPVSTGEKSGWRQFKTMVTVRTVNKLREPSALFVLCRRLLKCKFDQRAKGIWLRHANVRAHPLSWRL